MIYYIMMATIMVIFIFCYLLHIITKRKSEKKVVEYTGEWRKITQVKEIRACAGGDFEQNVNSFLVSITSFSGNLIDIKYVVVKNEIVALITFWNTVFMDCNGKITEKRY